MLIEGNKIKNILENHNIFVKGILHIGAHTGEENEHYKELGIRSALWVEAQPDIYLQLIKNVEQKRALNAAVWSTEIEMKFNVSDNSRMR